MRQRRQEQTPVSPQQARKLPRAQSHPQKVISSQPTGPFSERRRYERGSLGIPYRLRFQGKELSGYTEDISSGGLGLVSDPYLSLGTPLSLHFSFGNLCYLNISGQVVFCCLIERQGQPYHKLGIKFSASRDFDRKILNSSIQELQQSPAAQKTSLLNIFVSEDSFGLEAAELSISQSTLAKESAFRRPPVVSRRSSLEKADLLPRLKKLDYTAAAAQARREWLSAKTGAALEHLATFTEDPENMRGNIENLIGAAQIPVGVAGPLKIRGRFANGTFYVPMATTEGALIYTCNQGMLLLSLSGGATTEVLKDEVHIAPVFSFESVRRCQHFLQWLDRHFPDIKEKADSTTRHGNLVRLEPQIFDKNVAVKFCYTTGDASGMNMITFATEEACKYIVSTTRPQKYYLQSNFSSTKKVSFHNFLVGYGKSVVSEVVIPGSLIKWVFNVSPQDIVAYYQMVKLTTTHAGMIGISGHTANALAAVFLACGQDVASVVDSYIAVTNFELTENNSLYVSVKLPSLLVGTVGGGTHLATQNECLSLLGCNGPGQAKKFSEILAATVLAGEVAICAKVANGTFADAHKKYGRRYQPSLFAQPRS